MCDADPVAQQLGEQAGTYRVTVERTELIEFTLVATDPADAEARYLMDGDETGSKTVGTNVVSVELAPTQEAEHG